MRGTILSLEDEGVSAFQTDDLHPVDGDRSERVAETHMKHAGTESFDIASEAVAVLQNDNIGFVRGQHGGRCSQNEYAED
jgi:hypothetical protein